MKVYWFLVALATLFIILSTTVFFTDKEYKLINYISNNRNTN